MCASVCVSERIYVINTMDNIVLFNIVSYFKKQLASKLTLAVTLSLLIKPTKCF